MSSVAGGLAKVYLEKTRQNRRQSDQRFGTSGKTSDKGTGANDNNYYGFSRAPRYHLELNSFLPYSQKLYAIVKTTMTVWSLDEELFHT